MRILGWMHLLLIGAYYSCGMAMLSEWTSFAAKGVWVENSTAICLFMLASFLALHGFYIRANWRDIEARAGLLYVIMGGITTFGVLTALLCIDGASLIKKRRLSA